MRRVVTGEQVAQIYNPDPFARPVNFNGTAKHMLATRREVCLQGFGYCSWRQTADEAQVLTTPRNACKVRKSSHGKIMLPVTVHLPTDKRGCQ
jgi:hypothetical protein